MKRSNGKNIVIAILVVIIIGLLSVICLNYLGIVNISNEEIIVSDNDKVDDEDISEIVNVKLSEEEAWSLGKGLYDKATEIYETWVFRPYCYNKEMNDEEFVTFYDKNGYELNYYKTEFNSLEDLKKSLNNWLSFDIINEKIKEEEAFKDLSNLELYTNYIESDGYLYCRMDIGKGWMSMYLNEYQLEVKSIEENKISYNVKSTYIKETLRGDTSSRCTQFYDVNSCTDEQLEYKDTNFVIEKNDNNNWVVSEYTLHN